MILEPCVVTASMLAFAAILTWRDWRSHGAMATYLMAIGALALSMIVLGRPPSVSLFIVFEAACAGLRFAAAAELATVVFAPVPHVHRLAQSTVLGGLMLTLTLIGWGLFIPYGPRSTYRGLAVASGGAALILLALRVLALRYSVPLHPMTRVATTGLGAYLLVHSLLLGAATEGARLAGQIGSAVSSSMWCAWAVGLAFAAWTGRRWKPPVWMSRVRGAA